MGKPADGEFMTGPGAAQLLASALIRYDSRPALNAGGEQCTYRDLLHRTIDYQALARQTGLTATDRVLFSGETGLDFYACLLAGILGSYTVSVASAALPTVALANLIKRLRPDLVISEIPPGGAAAKCATRSPRQIRADESAGLTVAECPHAYLSLTSGTMGRPTSALVDALALRRFLEWAASEFELTQYDRWFEASDPGADLALTNALLAVSSGACLTIPMARQRLRAARLAAFNQTTVMRIVPAVAKLMLAEASRRPVSLPALRLLAFGGDELPAALPARMLQATRSSARTVNTYGMTEAAGFLLRHWFDPHRLALLADAANVPLGNPVPGVSARIEPCQGDQEPEAGEIADDAGELTIRSAAIALEICPEAGKSPASRKGAAGTMAELHTGDLVRHDDRGFIFCGRIDRAVKIRGMRVNLAQLERLMSDALGRSTGIVQHGDRLVALVESATSISRLEVAKYIGDAVMNPVIPHSVITVSRLPRTRSGKVSVAECAEIASRTFLGQRSTGHRSRKTGGDEQA